jgi:hypothetical protein
VEPRLDVISCMCRHSAHNPTGVLSSSAFSSIRRADSIAYKPRLIISCAQDHLEKSRLSGFHIFSMSVPEVGRGDSPCCEARSVWKAQQGEKLLWSMILARIQLPTLYAITSSASVSSTVLTAFRSRPHVSLSFSRSSTPTWYSFVPSSSLIQTTRQ